MLCRYYVAPRRHGEYLKTLALIHKQVYSTKQSSSFIPYVHCILLFTIYKISSEIVKIKKEIQNFTIPDFLIKINAMQCNFSTQIVKVG